jgi:hypothetical protein
MEKKHDQGQDLHKGILGPESQLNQAQNQTWNLLNMG